MTCKRLFSLRLCVNPCFCDVTRRSAAQARVWEGCAFAFVWQARAAFARVSFVLALLCNRRALARLRPALFGGNLWSKSFEIHSPVQILDKRRSVAKGPKLIFVTGAVP